MIKKGLICLSILINLILIPYLIIQITKPPKICNVDISGDTTINIMLKKPLKVSKEEIPILGKNFWDKEWENIKWRRLVKLDDKPEIIDYSDSASFVEIRWPIRFDGLNQEQLKKFSQIRGKLEKKLISLGEIPEDVRPNELDVIENILQRAEQ